MYIDIIFSPYELASRGNISNKSVIVIDVLRATSTIAYAFSGYKKNRNNEISGCSRIIPVETIEEVRELAKSYNKDEILTAGERDCIKPAGFDLGNSPDEYTTEKIFGKTIIFSTTNGTRALKLSQNAKFITTASFVNAGACANYVYKSQNDILILCAGRSSKTAAEDVACAGLITKMLAKKCHENNQTYDLSDAADISIKFINYYSRDIQTLLEKTEAGKNLIEVNLAKDISDCGKIDILPIITEYKDGFIMRKQ